VKTGSLRMNGKYTFFIFLQISLLCIVIRNIIFDLGGVIINLDPAATAKAFVKLGLSDWDNQYSQAKQSGLFDEYDKGKISDAEFRSGLRTFLPENVSDQQIDDAWNAMLLDIPPKRLELLSAVRKDHRIFLLSNTNFIHVKAFSASQRSITFSKKRTTVARSECANPMLRSLNSF
jgi:hypothetical protein